MCLRHLAIDVRRQTRRLDVMLCACRENAAVIDCFVQLDPTAIGIFQRDDKQAGPRGDMFER